MALIKRHDLAGYYAARPLKGNQIYIVPPSQPDAPSLSGIEPIHGDVNSMEPKFGNGPVAISDQTSR
jgi:hypothetical protein